MGGGIFRKTIKRFSIINIYFCSLIPKYERQPSYNNKLMFLRNTLLIPLGVFIQWEWERVQKENRVCYCYFVVLCCYLFLMITYTYKDTYIVLVVCVIAFSDIKKSISVTVSDSFLTVISVGAFKTFFFFFCGLFSKFTFNKWPISCKHRK